MDEMKEQILELKLAKSAVLEEKLKLQEDLQHAKVEIEKAHENIQKTMQETEDYRVMHKSAEERCHKLEDETQNLYESMRNLRDEIEVRDEQISENMMTV